MNINNLQKYYYYYIENHDDVENHVDIEKLNNDSNYIYFVYNYLYCFDDIFCFYE